ncbi:MAG: pyruvate ferredoxin oxidoreductase [Chloroflexi bacterium]|nr:pyruvate ferredoxin oxidoreductase [Chloroflexota bacterium]
MSKRVGMEVSLVVAEAVKLAQAEVIAAYPITPQTHIAEGLAEKVANGELDAEYICVESEHSAMSACLGSSAAGARTYTASAGQGLELMHEVLFVASSMRLPIVMNVANRALSGPLNVWGDHSDVMATRDTGWIQIFTENGQEVFDHTLCAFRIAEDPRVLIPMMVHLDGFHLSHMVEPLLVEDEEFVKNFLPPYTHPYALNPLKPTTMGAFTPPVHYTEAKKAQQVALEDSKKVVLEVWEEYGKLTGRNYKPVEGYRAGDAEVLLLMMGSYAETASLAVDKLRDEGHKVGLLKLRLWRPFPFEELRQAVKNARVVEVFDRCLSYGGPGGPVCSEVKAALYPAARKPRVLGFVGGLGGRDVFPEDFENILKKGIQAVKKRPAREFEMIGVRE